MSLRNRLLRPWLMATFFTLSAAATSLLAGQPRHAFTLYGEPPKYAADFQHFDYVNPQAPKGGQLRQAGFGSFDSLNPFINKGVPADDINLIYDTLTTSSLDEPFTVYGLVAEQMERADDNSWVRFYINPKARFNDGTPITADDVVFSFNALINKGAPMYRMYYGDVETVEAESPNQVIFRFKHAGNRELPLILGQLPVLPQHFWKDRDFASANLEIPLGSGPYVIDRVQAGRSIRYRRAKDYWAKDLPVNRGLYNFDIVNIDYYRDSGIALQAFKAGQFDYWFETSAKNWATAYDIPAVHEGRLKRDEIPNRNTIGMQGFVFNLRHPELQDIRVRKALTLLFDYEWTNRQLFNGMYSRSNSFFGNSELASHGLPDAAELALLEPWKDQLPAELFEQPFSLPVTNADGMIRDQQREAYRLLLEAGWKVENDQMVGPDGNPLKLEFLLIQPEFERVLLPYKRNLADLGIDLDIRRVDMSQYISRIRSRDFDMLVSSFPQSNSPGSEQREFWHSSSADNPGSRNYIGLQNPVVDDLVEKLIQADSRQALVTSSRALDRVLLSGYYVVPNWHTKVWRVAYWNKLRHPETPPSQDIGLMTWWQEPNAPAPQAVPTEPQDN